MFKYKICKFCFSYLLNNEHLIGWKCCPNCDFRIKLEDPLISLKELNKHNYPTTPEIDANLAILLEKANVIRAAYGKPMTISSGLRDTAQQQALIAAGKSNAPKSHHLTGEACDILDVDGSLKEWVKNNIQLFEDTGLWMEDFSATPTWIHVQIVPPKSKHRFFIP